MRQSIQRLWWSVLLAAIMGFTAGGAPAAGPSYRQVVDGVAVYFGIVPAELVRGHPPEHPEGQMHGGAPVGENHILVALFEDKTGKRLTGAEVSARVTGDRGLDVRKRAAFNGVPNLSVLDGWWIEGCIEGVTGWAISDATGTADGDARALYDKLAQVVLPLYSGYQGEAGGWIRVMKGAISKNASYFNSHRMMRRYATEAYIR